MERPRKTGGFKTCVVCYQTRAVGTEKFFLASFPKDVERCKKWVQVVGDEDLVRIPFDLLNKCRYVCNRHFKSTDFNKKGSRIRNGVVPSQNLGLPPLEDHQLEGFPCMRAPMAIPDKTEVKPVLERIYDAPWMINKDKGCEKLTASKQDIISNRLEDRKKTPEVSESTERYSNSNRLEDRKITPEVSESTERYSISNRLEDRKKTPEISEGTKRFNEEIITDINLPNDDEDNGFDYNEDSDLPDQAECDFSDFTKTSNQVKPPEKESFTDTYLRWLDEVNEKQYDVEMQEDDFNNRENIHSTVQTFNNNRQLVERREPLKQNNVYPNTNLLSEPYGNKMSNHTEKFSKHRKENLNIVCNILLFHDYTEVDANNICRLCAQPGNNDKMKNIFLNQGVILHKITTLFPSLNLYPNDGLPQNICNGCYVQIEDAYEFYENAIVCENKLRSIFNVESPIVQNYITCPDKTSKNQNTENPTIIEPHPHVLSLYKKNNDKLSVEFVIEKVDQMFHCPFCDYKFSRKSLMINHFNKSHLLSENTSASQDYVMEYIENTDDNHVSHIIAEQNQSQFNKAAEHNQSHLSIAAEHNQSHLSIASEHNQSHLSLAAEHNQSHLSITAEHKQSNNQSEINYENIEVDDLIKTFVKRKAPIPSYNCDTCSLTFTKKSDRYFHEKTHPSECYRCSRCSRVFSNPTYIKEHTYSTHHVILSSEPLKIQRCSIFECEHCCVLYSNPAALIRHRSRCPLLFRGIYRCRCSEKFNDFSKFVIHGLSKSGCVSKDPERPKCRPFRICSICKVKSCELFTHIKTHHLSLIMDNVTDRMERGFADDTHLEIIDL